ncbi:MAG: hypothetical protein QMD53_02155 [Actinomycetota bacterium]|nr:hypothetical protein [Actinomycetota bacterium]
MARDKCKTNIVVDIASAVAFLLSLVSGMVLWLVLPSGSGFQGGAGAAGPPIFLDSADTTGWPST